MAPDEDENWGWNWNFSSPSVSTFNERAPNDIVKHLHDGNYASQASPDLPLRGMSSEIAMNFAWDFDSIWCAREVIADAECHRVIRAKMQEHHSPTAPVFIPGIFRFYSFALFRSWKVVLLCLSLLIRRLSEGEGNLCVYFVKMQIPFVPPTPLGI